MRENIVQPVRPQWQYGACALYAGCLIPPTHSEYVIRTVFTPQQCLHERAQMVRCTCIACLVINVTVNILRNRTEAISYKPVSINMNVCLYSCCSYLAFRSHVLCSVLFVMCGLSGCAVF